MIRKLLLAWAIVLALTGFTYQPLKGDPLDLAPVLSAMMYEGVWTNVEWRDCGEVNAFYQPERQTVVMCHELLPLPPAVIRTILAHELAHGVIRQRGIPYTTNEEGAADELATYVLLLSGRQQDVLDSAAWWIARGQEGDDPFDPHPSDARRALSMICLAKGSQGLYSPMCNVSWPRVVGAWNRLLELN